MRALSVHLSRFARDKLYLAFTAAAYRRYT